MKDKVTKQESLDEIKKAVISIRSIVTVQFALQIIGFFIALVASSRYR